MRLQDAIIQYLEWKSLRSSRAAVAYRIHLKRLHEIVKKDTKKIKETDLVAFLSLIEQRYNPPTVAYTARVTKNFVRWLRAIRQCDIDPFLIQEVKYLRKERLGVNEGEYKALCKTLNPWNSRDLQRLVAIGLLWETGMRVSEVCGLNISQISSTKTFAQIETKKNKKLRWVMWSKGFHKLLLRHIAWRITSNQMPPLLYSRMEGTYNGGRIQTRQVQRWINEASIKAKIKMTTPHMFRHAKAHRMKAKGADLKDIQTMLGHSSLTSCIHYLNPTKEETMEMMSKYL